MRKLALIFVVALTLAGCGSDGAAPNRDSGASTNPYRDVSDEQYQEAEQQQYDDAEAQEDAKSGSWANPGY